MGLLYIKVEDCQVWCKKVKDEGLMGNLGFLFIEFDFLNKNTSIQKEPNLDPMKNTNITENDAICKEYIHLIIRYLKQHKQYASKPNLTPEDKRVLEYHLKDVARHAVLANTSIEECVAIFESRITRLIEGDHDQWESFLEIIRRYKNFLTKLDFITVDEFFRYFTKKQISGKS
jgi:hypothetical protein